MGLNKRCPDFEGRYTCTYFISNGACSLQTRFMCHVFIDTDKPPVEDDVPLFTKEVLGQFPGSTVEKVNPSPWSYSKEAKNYVKAESRAKQKASQQQIEGVQQKKEEKKKKLEDIFGKF